MAKHRLEDVIPAGLPNIAPATVLSVDDIVLRHATPIPEVPAPYEPSILDKARAGLQTVGHAIAETGRWFNRHKIGVARAVGAVAAFAAVAGTVRATGDLGFYATIHEAGKTFIDLDTPSENLLAGGAASALSVMSVLAAMTMKNFAREDAAQQAWEANNDEQPFIDVENLGYIRPGQRLTWMDEDDIFATVPLLSQKKTTPAHEDPLSVEGAQLIDEIERVLKEDSGLHQLVPAGR